MKAGRAGRSCRVGDIRECVRIYTVLSATGDPLHSRALAHSRAPLLTQPCPHCSHSRAPGEQWARLCVFTLQGCVQAARLCRGSPVSAYRMVWTFIFARYWWKQYFLMLNTSAPNASNQIYAKTVCLLKQNPLECNGMTYWCIFDLDHVSSWHWRHNDHDGVSNHQPHGCLLNRLFKRRSKKTSKLHVTGLCAGNSPGPVNSPRKGPVTRKMLPFDDVIMRLSFGLDHVS